MISAIDTLRAEGNSPAGPLADPEFEQRTDEVTDALDPSIFDFTIPQEDAVDNLPENCIGETSPAEDVSSGQWLDPVYVFSSPDGDLCHPDPTLSIDAADNTFTCHTTGSECGIQSSTDGVLQQAESACLDGGDNAPLSQHPLSLGHPSPDMYAIPTEPIDLPTKLIHTYFAVVCPRFSTFDSRQNLFRTFVDKHWQDSKPMYFTMLSMAAAKLGYEATHWKKPAFMFQTLALQALSTALANSTAWNTELLFVVLMLGLSACWHNMHDLGIPHLKALHQAVSNNTTLDICDGVQVQSREFFKDALTYWEMVISFMKENDPACESPGSDTSPWSTTEEGRIHVSGTFKQIVPHPWTSIASVQQTMFTRVAQLIRQVRSFDQNGSSAATLAKPAAFLNTLVELEEELWTLKLPSLHEIANTGDENTPAVHHLLMAEAYMFANFYQLYSVFPNLRRRRARLVIDAPSHTSGRERVSWAQSQSGFWSSILETSHDDDDWLRFLGQNIVNRIEQIQISSGTSCLHPLLLVIGSTALSISPEKQGTAAEEESLRMRDFIDSRMERLSGFYMSDRIRCARKVSMEIFKRLDVGVQVFWMDVMTAMGVVTVLG